MKACVLTAAIIAAASAFAAKKAEEPVGRPEAVVAMLNSSASGSPKAYADAVAAVAEDAAAGCPMQKFVMALFSDEKSMPAKLRVSGEARAGYYAAGRARVDELARESNPLALYLLALDTGDTNTLRRAAEGGNVQAANAWGMALMSEVDGPVPDESARDVMKSAFGFFRDAASLGDANGLYNMGTCYARGLGVEQDDKRAYECFKAAADKGHPQAINNLGWCHLRGKGVKEDHTEAAKCFAKSADFGNAEGQLNYALALLSGDGVKVNHRTAAALLLMAARQDNPDAINAYAVCISKGRGVKCDPALAVRWFRIAAEMGHPPAMDNLASCYELGEGVEKSEEKSVYWHMRSLAVRGDAYAQRWLEEREGREVLCYAGSNGWSGRPAEEREAFRTLAVNTATGAVREIAVEKGFDGTTYFAVSRDRTLLYTIRNGSGRGGMPGRLVRYRLSGGAAAMDWEIDLPCEAPCHVSLSPDEKTVAFAAYNSAVAGTVDVATKKVCSVVHEGSGPRKDRQEKAHAHCAFFTPAGDRVGIVDLGIDQVRFYDLAMRPDPSMTITVEPGLGPRHAVFSPDGKLMFLVHELGNAVSSYRFDGRRFELADTKSTLPEGYSGETKAAAVKTTADGGVVMASNRGHDSIAFFSVDPATGKLSPKNIARLRGRFPRDFELVPGEKFMIVGHKMSDEIQIYAFDRETCSLEPAGAPLKAFRPLCFKFGAFLPLQQQGDNR